MLAVAKVAGFSPFLGRVWDVCSAFLAPHWTHGQLGDCLPTFAGMEAVWCLEELKPMQTITLASPVSY